MTRSFWSAGHSAQAALTKTGGNITKAATLLGMTRPRLSQIVKEHKIDRRKR